MVKFPSNPQIGDIFTLNSKTWEFNGVGWVQKTIESDLLFNSFLNTGGTVNGNLTINGVLSGNGSGLTNIPASGVTDLNLDRIVSDKNNAIISSSGLTVNTDTYIQGDINSTTMYSKNYYIIDQGSTVPLIDMYTSIAMSIVL